MAIVDASIRFDRIADTYDDTRGGEERGIRFATAMMPLLDPDAPLLEVGVGTGTVAQAFAAFGFRVIGVDLSEPMLRHARARIGPTVVAGDAAMLPVRSGSFRQTVSTWVLHLVADVPAVLNEVARVLTPGGRYLVIPGRMRPTDDPIGRVKAMMAEALAADRARRARVEPEALRESAPTAGLEVVDVIDLESYEVGVSADEEARRLEERSYSGLWDIDAETWARVVEPAIAALRALPEDQRHATHQVVDSCIVLEKR